MTPRPYEQHLRLDIVFARAMVGHSSIDGPEGGPATHRNLLYFQETGPAHRGLIALEPDHYTRAVGDIILARRDFGTSYHLAVVLDDAAQGVTHVTRGEDLFEATAIHVLIQALLELPTPNYHHHKLIRDEDGKRLAKRDDARTIATYRAEGASPQDIRRMVGL